MENRPILHAGFVQTHVLLPEKLVERVKHNPELKRQYLERAKGVCAKWFKFTPTLAEHISKEIALVFPTMQVGVHCKSGWAAVAPKRFGSLAELQDVHVRVLALSPCGEDYKVARANLLHQAKGYSAETCLSCSNVEYTSSLLFNSKTATRDCFVLPLGYTFVGEEPYILGIPMVRTNEQGLDSNAVLQRIIFAHNNILLYHASRLRGECTIVEKNGQWFVLRRLRLNIS